MATARDQHEELLVQLHREMKEGRRDGERADQIGDEMNRLWAELDDRERELFDELSEDLYLIEGKRLVAPLEEGETVESTWRRTAIAFKEGRDRDTLALVRKLSELYGRVVRMVEVAWTDSAALPSLRASGLPAAGFSYEHLGRPADALHAFERAMAISEAGTLALSPRLRWCQ
jgi:hypothetical protein